MNHWKEIEENISSGVANVTFFLTLIYSSSSTRPTCNHFPAFPRPRNPIAEKHKQRRRKNIFAKNNTGTDSVPPIGLAIFQQVLHLCFFDPQSSIIRAHFPSKSCAPYRRIISIEDSRLRLRNSSVSITVYGRERDLGFERKSRVPRERSRKPALM